MKKNVEMTYLLQDFSHNFENVIQFMYLLYGFTFTYNFIKAFRKSLKL